MNIKIELTEREWFGLTQSAIGSQSKRKQFGAFELVPKISNQLIPQLTEEQIKALKEEWRAIKSELPAITPKKPKRERASNFAPKKIEGYIVRD
jgi:hypothetical protein